MWCLHTVVTGSTEWFVFCCLRKQNVIWSQDRLAGLLSECALPPCLSLNPTHSHTHTQSALKLYYIAVLYTAAIKSRRLEGFPDNPGNTLGSTTEQLRWLVEVSVRPEWSPLNLSLLLGCRRLCIVGTCNAESVISFTKQVVKAALKINKNRIISHLLSTKDWELTQCQVSVQERLRSFRPTSCAWWFKKWIGSLHHFCFYRNSDQNSTELTSAQTDKIVCIFYVYVTLVKAIKYQSFIICFFPNSVMTEKLFITVTEFQQTNINLRHQSWL